MTGADHTVEVFREPGQGLYGVRVVPETQMGFYDATYATKREAWGYACGLRLTNQWPIIDRTGGGVDDPARG